jgi:hypothetical protein
MYLRFVNVSLSIAVSAKENNIFAANSGDRRFCSHSFAETGGSNGADCMDVRLLCLLCGSGLCDVT